VPSKLWSCVAAAALFVQLSGCASSPAASAGGSTAATKADKQKAPASGVHDPKSFAEAVQRGDAAWQQQDFDRAVYYYVLAMNKSPHDASTLAKIGAIEDFRGNAVLAEKAFEMAHEADPQEPRVAARLARLYLRSGKVDSASDLYAQVLAHDPNRSRALDGMGEVCVARSDFAGAIRYFDQALQGDNPDTAAVLTNRGYAKLRMDDLTGAEADFRAALAGAPREDAWRYLGDLQARRGDTAEALESLLNVMDTGQAYNEIGVVFMSVKNYQDARDYFTKSIRASAAWSDEAQKNLAVADEHLAKVTR